ncbi:MAG: primosomal protein N' [Paludibacteraceae bacterium]|nr:primosomal protein N' [Paludibacteraceae bacterium]
MLPLAIRDCYTYSISDDLSLPQAGCRVMVPLMRKKIEGIVLREHTEPILPEWIAKIRPIEAIIDTTPIVSAEQLSLWQWMSDYYMCTLGEVMNAAMPAGLLDDSYAEKTTEYISLPLHADIEANKASLRRAPKQLQLYEIAVQMCAPTGRVERTNLLNNAQLNSSELLRALIAKGLLIRHEEGVSRIAPYQGPIESLHDLSPAQQKAVEQIHTFFQAEKNIVLLHGVTSSGKTDVYIHLIQEQLAQSKSVLYLVPEIALTTQLTSRLQCVFGDQLLVYHSRISDAERVEIYQAAAQPTPRVIIGARSAIFLPITNMGLIIVDEEHEPSYKQVDPAPRYHARAAAIMLAKQHKAKVLLGTATPAIESYYLAQKGVYGLVSLTERYGGAQLPTIQLVDLKRQYHRKEMYGHFSDPLVERIRETLAEGKQVILFQNRRGYAPQWQCTSCGKPPRCIQCDVPMTLHKRANELRCHYCGYHAPIPTQCPECGGEMKTIGFGTERIEDEIQHLFPEARVLRMDLDTTRSKHAHQEIINAFAKHECDILVGTQMVTKGLHFDDVRLVAVLNADPILNQPDFRAYERAFQMLEQVAGRAGRKGQKGEVWIQSFDPHMPIFQMVKAHDYNALYEAQLAERELFNYPPFCRLIRLRIRHANNIRVHEATTYLQQYLQQVFDKRVSAVIVPSVERVQAYYIREITLRIEQNAPIVEAKRRLQQAITHLMANSIAKGIQITIDIDPM